MAITIIGPKKSERFDYVDVDAIGEGKLRLTFFDVPAVMRLHDVLGGPGYMQTHFTLVVENAAYDGCAMTREQGRVVELMYLTERPHL